MMLNKISIVFITILSLVSVISAKQILDVGMQIQAVSETKKYRAFEMTIFYPVAPTVASQKTLVADNPIFYGVEVIENAKPLNNTQKYPLVIISHGFGGSWRNQVWLAHALAQKGFIVVSPNHPGSTTRDVNPAKGAALWKRVGDVSHAIDVLLENAEFAEIIDTEKVALIGHSLGGWTTIAAIGGRFNGQKILEYCQHYQQSASCLTLDELKVDLSAGNQSHLGQNLRDERIKAAVSMDLGLAQGFTEKSLGEIKTPTLIILAENDPLLPIKDESGYLKQHMPASIVSYKLVPFATHFSFMQSCKKGAMEILREDHPNDEKICLPEKSQPHYRDQIHQKVIQDIEHFLRQKL